jgi:hypothetical protein
VVQPRKQRDKYKQNKETKQKYKTTDKTKKTNKERKSTKRQKKRRGPNPWCKKTKTRKMLTTQAYKRSLEQQIQNKTKVAN